MFEPNFKSKFIRKEKKLTKNNPKLKKAVSKAMVLLLQNPGNPALKSHKVRDANGDFAFSSKVTSDIRIIWDYKNGKANIIDILNIGGHEGGSGVYS